MEALPFESSCGVIYAAVNEPVAPRAVDEPST